MVIHFPHPSSGLEEKELGTGGKPPVDHRPTGGGGGGGDDGWNDGVNPHARLDRVRVILALALCVDVLTFVIVMASSLGCFASASADLHASPDWHLSTLLPWLLFNAALLMTSCLTVEQARRQIFCEIDVMEEWLGLGKPALRRALPWLGVTLGLGGIFLTVQFLTWQQMIRPDGVTSLGSLRTSAIFSQAAGLHGIHLGLGLAALVFCLCALSGLGRVELRQIVIDAVAWFWHTMGLVWLLLLGMFVLSQ